MYSDARALWGSRSRFHPEARVSVQICSSDLCFREVTAKERGEFRKAFPLLCF